MKLAIITQFMKNKLKCFSLKKLLLLILTLTTLGVIGGVVYVLGVIEEIKPIMSEVDVLSKDSGEKMLVSEVEAEAVTSTLALKRFLTFADDSDERAEFLKSFTDPTTTKTNTYTFKSNGKLPGLIKNDCTRYRCLQNKVEFRHISSSLWKGLLGIEDYRFLDHAGVDPISIARAIIVDIKSMKLVQGGSTLTQQLVKNLFLSNEKTFQRKIKEMIYALYIEFFYEKEQIITAYFNEVFWGTMQGVYLKGIDVASRAYFDKSAKNIDEFEAAILISLLKGPYYYHPIRYSERLKSRVGTVFERLKELGLISKNTPAWDETKWNQWLQDIARKDQETYLRTIALFNKDAAVINDYEKYILIEGAFEFLKSFRAKDSEKDIAVKVFILPVNCKESECLQGFRFYSKLERDLDTAITQERHQVGSILKPIVYKIFLKQGKSLDDLVSTDEITLNLKSGKWTPRDSRKFEGQDITLLQALQLSKNRPLIRTAQEIGFNVIENDLKGYVKNLMTPLSEFPAQLLGAVELSLAEVGQIYQKFTKDTCAEIDAGKIEFENTIFYHMANAEKTTIRGYANDLIANTLIFGKTGTTNNGNDNWYIASDGHLVTIIWTGIETREQGEKTALSGASSSFKIYQNFIVNRGKRLSEIYCM